MTDQLLQLLVVLLSPQRRERERELVDEVVLVEHADARELDCSVEERMQGRAAGRKSGACVLAGASATSPIELR